MKLKILELKETDRKSYEDFLNNNNVFEHSMFYHTWEWGEFMSSNALAFKRIAIYDNEIIIATAQVALQKFRFGTYWYCPRGLLLDYKKNSIVKEAHKAASSYFKNLNGASFLRVDPNIIKNDTAVKPIDDAGAKTAGIFIQAQHVWISNIFDNEEDQIRWGRENGMRRKLPNQMRKGIREGVTFRVSSDESDLEKFIQLLDKLEVRKGGIGKRKDDYYKNQFLHMAPSGYEKLFIAERNGKVLAMNLFAIYGKEASYLHGASLDEDRDLSAPSILHIKSMVYIKQNYPSVERYNFWGIVSAKNAVPSNPHNGYSEFKKSFGGFEVEYIDPRDFVYNKPKWLLNYAIEKRRRLKLRID